MIPRRLVPPLGVALVLLGALAVSARGALVAPTAQSLAEDLVKLARQTSGEFPMPVNATSASPPASSRIRGSFRWSKADSARS